jgi:flagellar biosynthesis protein FliQ
MPTLLAGLTNVKLVALTYVVVQIVEPTYTFTPALNPVPVTVIVSPPAIGRCG